MQYKCSCIVPEVVFQHNVTINSLLICKSVVPYEVHLSVHNILNYFWIVNSLNLTFAIYFQKSWRETNQYIPITYSFILKQKEQSGCIAYQTAYT